MAVQDSPEPGYLPTAGYLLRRRERFWLGSIIFVYAFPGSLLTLVTVGYLHGYPSVAEVIYFGPVWSRTSTTHATRWPRSPTSASR